MFSHRINLDYASLTPVDKRVLRVMRKYSATKYANPSAWYREGVAAKKVLEASRKSVAEYIHAHPDEIYFTAGGTEANNIAILGAVQSAKNSGRAYSDMKVIVSTIEHSSVIEIAEHLKTLGVAVDHVGVDSQGVANVSELKEKLDEKTILVSVMMVNNEVGSIQPMKEIAKVIRHFKTAKRKLTADKLNVPQDSLDNNAGQNDIKLDYPLFHTDAAQAFLIEDLNTEKLAVDLVSMDGSKVYGPRGIGALYIRRGRVIAPITFGGGQEHGIRSGTENIASVAGFAEALRLVTNSRKKEIDRLRDLRSMFIQGLRIIDSGISVNGAEAKEQASPHIANISIPGIDNEYFVFQLDAHGVACSTKSSCLRDAGESYVLKAMGKNGRESVRFSFGRWTTKRDLKRALMVISRILEKREKRR